jgi:hypothetical protein
MPNHKHGLKQVTHYVQQARFAVAYVKSKMSSGADNRPWDVITSLGESSECVPEMRGKYASDFHFSLPMAEQIKVAAIWAERSGCGNCWEQSAIAYQWLLRNNVLPVEFMQFEHPKDHAFVVLGRDPTTWIAQPSSWGPSAVVCDAWKNKAYAPGMLNQFWPFGVPKRVVGAPEPPQALRASSGR